MPTGQVVRASPNRFETITWTPIFDEHVPHRMVDSNGNFIKESSLAADAQGMAGSDGTSRIFPESFLGAANLAATLIHEKVHFDQFTTAGRGDVLTPGELEVEAYETEVAAEKAGVLLFSDWQKETYETWIKEQLRKRKAQAKAEREWLDGNLGWIDPPTSSFVEPVEKAKLAQIQKDAVSLRKNVMRETAQDILHQAARGICESPLAVGLGASADAYSKGCSTFPRGDKPWLIDDPITRQMEGCQREAMSILGRCDDAARVAVEIDAMREERFEDAVDRFRRVAANACSRGEFDFNERQKACDQLPAMPDYELRNRVKAKGVTPCENSLLNVLLTCVGGYDDVLPGVQDVLSRYPRHPPSTVSPPSREADREALTKLYQGMADVCYDLCSDPSDAWEKYDVFCDNRRQARVIEGRYTSPGETLPANWERDTTNSPCGWEFFTELMKNSKGMCFGKDGEAETAWARRFKGYAGRLNQKHHPPQPPPSPTPNPSPAPQPVPPRGGGGGGWSPKQACERHGGRWSGSVCLKDPDP